MSPTLLARALSSARYSRRLTQGHDGARYPRDYYRPVDPRMILWLRPALPAQWR